MATLLNRTLAGLGKTASLTAVKSGLDFAILLALIRIFRVPEPIGQFVFLFVWIEFFNRLSNFGGYRYLIQRRELRREDIATVLSTETGAALIWAPVWFFIMPDFFQWIGREDLMLGVMILTPWLLTERFSATARAILEHDLRFGRANTALLLGTVTLGAVTIPLALAGWGALAWVIGKVAQSAVTCLAMWLFVGMRPPLGWRRDAARPYLRFGMPLFAADLLQFYNWNVPIVVIGLLLRSDSVLALYWIAYKLPEYLMQLQGLVSTVVYPAFTRARDDQQLRAGFHLVTKYSAAVAGLPAALALALGTGIMLHLLREDFEGGTRAFQIFTGLAAFRMTTVHWYHAYVAKGRTGATPLITGLTALGVTVGALLGVQWGASLGGDLGAITGVAIGMALTSITVILIAINVFLKRVIEVHYLPCLVKPVIATAAALAVGLALRAAGIDQTQAVAFWAMVAVMTAVYLAVGFALDARAMRDLWRRSRS